MVRKQSTGSQPSWLPAVLVMVTPPRGLPRSFPTERPGGEGSGEPGGEDSTDWDRGPQAPGGAGTAGDGRGCTAALKAAAPALRRKLSLQKLRG